LRGWGRALGVYVARRMGEAIVTLFLASLLVFGMVAALPGDPALIILGDNATPDQVRALRAHLALDRPVPVQYAEWIERIVHGNLGYSFINGISVRSIVARALPLTLQVSLWAFGIVLLIAFPAGIVAATRPRSHLARCLNWYHGWALAVPVFWLGLLLSWFFGVVLRWLPPSGFVPLTQDPIGWVRSLILPGLTLGLGVGSIMARFVQAALEDVLHEDYIRTARAKGLRDRVVVSRHGLRNALIPVATVLGMQAGFFIGGAVITEAVFAIPGLGSALWRSILTRDYLVTQSIILLGIVGFVLINLCTDLVYGLLDPRIRYS
jgi:peptide/nickel transport system permease protein